ncbi:hypothetical protein [Ornithinibacillus xuwenensis]|uniref:Uncharacterized protein n=1 Tax=Ornithinibacillus xuwenensis TaxID=3144668 RepID=A0ABU9XBL3_9BACI
MSNKNKNESPKRKTHLKLGKETYGKMPIEECFIKAFEPYFNPDKAKHLYLNRLG